MFRLRLPALGECFVRHACLLAVWPLSGCCPVVVCQKTAADFIRGHAEGAQGLRVQTTGPVRYLVCNKHKILEIPQVVME